MYRTSDKLFFRFQLLLRGAALLSIFLLYFPGTIRAEELPPAAGGEQTNESSPAAGDEKNSPASPFPDESLLEQYGPAVRLVLEGNRACREGRYEEAVKAYESAFIGYGSVDALFNLGVTYEINLKNKKKAIFYYEKFLQFEPDSEDALHVRKWVAGLKAYLYKAPEIRRAFGEKPEEKKPREEERRLLSDLSPEVAILSQKMLKEGNIAAMQGKYEEAIAKYKEVVSLYDSSDAYYNLGVIYEKKLENPEQAVPYYTKYVKLEPSSREAHKIAAWLKEFTGTNPLKK